MPLRPQPHELCWGGFLLALLAKTGAALSLPLLAGWLALVAGFIVSCRWLRADPPRRRWAWASYALAMNCAFQLLGPSMAAGSQWRADATLQQIDVWLVGGNLSLGWQKWLAWWPNELFSLGYLFFMVLLFASLIWHLFQDDPGRCYRGLFVVYGLGFLGYVLVPAAGPYVALADSYTTPIVGGPLTALNQLMVARGSNHVDVFPSLHIAVSLYLWLVLWRDHRRLALGLLPLMLLLWGSTLYLRYHYFVDVLAGLALASLAFWLTSDSRRTSEVVAAPARH